MGAFAVYNIIYYNVRKSTILLDYGLVWKLVRLRTVPLVCPTTDPLSLVQSVSLPTATEQPVIIAVIITTLHIYTVRVIYVSVSVHPSTTSQVR